MHEENILKQPRDEIERLKRENELLKDQLVKLEARLANYENLHTPPSLRRGHKRKREHNGGKKGKAGQKVGHKWVSTPFANPDQITSGPPHPKGWDMLRGRAPVFPDFRNR